MSGLFGGVPSTFLVTVPQGAVTTSTNIANSNADAEFFNTVIPQSSVNPNNFYYLDMDVSVGIAAPTDLTLRLLLNGAPIWIVPMTFVAIPAAVGGYKLNFVFKRLAFTLGTPNSLSCGSQYISLIAYQTNVSSIQTIIPLDTSGAAIGDFTLSFHAQFSVANPGNSVVNAFLNTLHNELAF